MEISEEKLIDVLTRFADDQCPIPTCPLEELPTNDQEVQRICAECWVKSLKE